MNTLISNPVNKQQLLNKQATKALKEVMPRGSFSSTTNKPFSKKKKLRILSIDGGGIRGIIPAVILANLEQRLQSWSGDPAAKLSDYFDFFAGTSTGGILACLYLIQHPDKLTEAKMSAAKVLEIFLERGHQTFAPPFSEKLASRKKLVENKYSAEPLEENLKKLLGAQTCMSQLIKPALITAYDIINRQSVLFKSWQGLKDSNQDYKIWQVGRATSAAPGFFEPAIVDGYNNNAPLIDGSVFASNPAMCAFAEASNLAFSTFNQDSYEGDFPNPAEMILVSLSTGASNKVSDHTLVNGKGLSWIRPIIEILLSSNAEITDHQLQKLFNQRKDPNVQNYFRLEPELQSTDDAIDNIKANNLETLYESSMAYISQHEALLDKIAQRLIDQC